MNTIVPPSKFRHNQYAGEIGLHGEHVTVPLKPLHADDSLIKSKLEMFGKLSNQQLIDSLRPGNQESLKVRPDGTILDGHHRIKILRSRGVDVDLLPREVIPQTQGQDRD